MFHWLIFCCRLYQIDRQLKNVELNLAHGLMVHELSNCEGTMSYDS